METKQIILDFSDDLNMLIGKKKFPLQQKLLEIEGVDKIKREFIEVEGEPIHKDLSLVIVTSAASFYIVMKAIGQLIETVKGSPINQVVQDLEPIRNPDGTILTNKDGDPIMSAVTKVISNGSKESTSSIGISGLIRILFKEKTNQP